MVFAIHSISGSIFLAYRIVVIATRPSSITEVIGLDLPRPRHRSNPAFTALKRYMKQMVRAEVQKLDVL
ncbi:hypothetical protein [Roseomonas chloroacetimidivorans]|uniref:hypothetical protein n=1 Tax=Roseomonas chloroacetimidivorans TaxID=1766656 RepID=UPI003C725A38